MVVLTGIIAVLKVRFQKMGQSSSNECCLRFKVTKPPEMPPPQKKKNRKLCQLCVLGVRNVLLRFEEFDKGFDCSADHSFTYYSKGDSKGLIRDSIYLMMILLFIPKMIRRV